jgi:hypothetical protein
MVLALLVVIVAIIILMSFNGTGQVPWANKLKRVHAGVARKAEWIAPDDVVAQARIDYLAAVNWLQESMLSSWEQRWENAPAYLSGKYLKRYQTILNHYRVSGNPFCVGVMRADQQVTVRHFSEDGQRCLIIDRQSQRRMATYDYFKQTRISTQDLGSGIVVYQMLYDQNARRWKIENFIQELPTGWDDYRKSQRIRTLSALPTVIGRDH